MALQELERLELEEEELRAELFRLDRHDASLRRASFASLSEIEASLRENEALFSFQVALWEDIYGEFGGGAWLLVSTQIFTPRSMTSRAQSSCSAF